MADERFTIEAVLQARDQGFLAGMKSASQQADTLGARLKKGLGFGVFQAIGSKAVSAVGGSLSGLMSEMSSSQAAWKTFAGNMQAVHGASRTTAKQITSLRSELQKYAQDTIYSSSDMATTYSQLDAVGIKSADKLVMAFGGLASAAENPVQAMKTLSQQGTQMAAKPTVAWQDFKLMLEQTPAGISQVAKAMGISTGELVKRVQDGTVKTKDFFKAVEQAGNSKAMQNQARQYKTLGQAMDGLQETLANKLLPAWDAVSTIGAKAIGGLIDKIGSLNTDQLAAKIQSFGQKASKYMKPLSRVAGEVFSAFSRAFKSIGKGMAQVTGAFGSAGSVKTWTGAVQAAGNALKTFAGFIEKHGQAIGRALPLIAKLLIAYKGFGIVKNLSGHMAAFSRSILGMAQGGLKGLAAKLFGVGAGERDAGAGAVQSSAMIKDEAIAFLALGAGVLMAAAGLYVIATAAIKLAAAGPGAVIVMLGMTAALAGLAYGASLIGPALTAGSVGLLSFGAAVLMAGAGVALIGAGLLLMARAANVAATAVIRISTVLPILSKYGFSAAASIMALGTGLLVFGASAGVAAVGGLAMGAAVLVLAGGMALLKAALIAVNSSMKSIASRAKAASASLANMKRSISMVQSGLGAIGAKASSAFAALKAKFIGAAASAKSSGAAVGRNFSSAMRSGLNSAKTYVSSAVNSAIHRMRNGASRAYSAGSAIGQGLARGMSSQLRVVRSVGAQLAEAADAAVKAKAKIGSPSRVQRKNGRWITEGLAVGMRDRISDVKTAAGDMIRSAVTPGGGMSFAAAGAGAGADGSQIHYGSSGSYTIEIPVTLDGRQIAKVTAPYTEAELNKRSTRADRKKGIRWACTNSEI